MALSTSTLVGQIVLTVAGIAVYHVAFAPRGSGAASDTTSADGASGDAVAALRRDVDALRRGTTGGSGGTDLSAAKFDALLSRVAALEGRLIPASAEAGANQGRLPSGVGDKPGTWTEEQITSLRAMLDEVEVRRNADRETASYRDLVKRVAPTLSAADEAAAVSLLTKFMRTIRGLFAGGSAGNTEEERAATSAKAAAERARLFQDLGALLPKDVVERLSPHIPDFTTSPGHIPPNRESPSSGK